MSSQCCHHHHTRLFVLFCINFECVDHSDQSSIFCQRIENKACALCDKFRSVHYAPQFEQFPSATAKPDSAISLTQESNLMNRKQHGVIFVQNSYQGSLICLKNYCT